MHDRQTRARKAAQESLGFWQKTRDAAAHRIRIRASVESEHARVSCELPVDAAASLLSVPVSSGCSCDLENGTGMRISGQLENDTGREEAVASTWTTNAV
jgi:hypothetical protein